MINNNSRGYEYKQVGMSLNEQEQSSDTCMHQRGKWVDKGGEQTRQRGRAMCNRHITFQTFIITSEQ